jgi:hypothetical protein
MNSAATSSSTAAAPLSVSNSVPSSSSSSSYAASSSSSRFIIGTKKEDAIIIQAIPPASRMTSCYVCCKAPSCCACVSTCPCCEHPEYITMKVEESTYIYIRENSLEWNDPQIVFKSGNCCGIDICLYDVQVSTHIFQC